MKLLHNRPLGACMIAAVIVPAVAAVLMAARSTPGPPLPVVEPNERRVSADEAAKDGPARGKIITTYTVTNRGGKDLVLGDAMTTCGCTVAAVEPRVVKPGQRATVTVEAVPPDVGEKGVRIRIGANTTRKEVILKLTMTATDRPPLVAFDSKAVRFGIVRAPKAREEFFVETREVTGEPPWIRRVTCTVADVIVHGGLVKEVKLPGGVSFRRYVYTAELARLPEPGEFQGELLVKAGDTKAPPVKTLQIYGLVRPPVFAAPKSLYASYDPSEGPPLLRLRLVADDPKFSLSAEPVTDESSALTVQRTGGGDASPDVWFEVTPRDVKNANTINATVDFKTNHPKMPKVSVPVTFRVIDGAKPRP